MTDEERPKQPEAGPTDRSRLRLACPTQSPEAILAGPRDDAVAKS
jgi:hypothetical protein